LRSNTSRLAFAWVVTALLLAGGCQTAHVQQPLTGELGGNDPNEQLEFWHRLANAPVTSNDDAFHGLLLFLDGDDPATDYASRVQTLKSRKMLPGNFNQPAGQAVERGTLAVALVKALDIKGGLVLRLLGPNPRYAVRELVFMELYPQSSPRQTFSGAEFLGIIGKVEDYQREQEASARGRRRDVGPTVPQIPPEPRPGVEPRPRGTSGAGAQPA
jgi:hypothetical protein